MRKKQPYSRAVLALALLGLSAAANELPDFGSTADIVLSKSREQQLGRNVMVQLRNAGAVMDDPLLTEYVTLLGSKLATHANDGDHRFQFFMVEDPSINAFAMPGGYIGINSGLILASENESELAGVLAHEVSHVTQRHIARSLYDNQRQSILTVASTIAAVLLGAVTDASPNAVQGLLQAGQAAAIQRQLNFTRSNEQEADRIGIEVLSAAGFDPNGMATFFEKLSRRYGTSGQIVPEFLRSHPISASRVAEARSRARILPAVTNVDSIGYGLAKARLQVLTAGSAAEAMAVFDRRGDSDLPADRYGRSLALMRAGLHDTAGLLLDALVNEFPSIVAYRIARAEALFDGGEPERAMAFYREAVEISPRNIPLTISYAERLLVSGNPAEAHRILLDLLNNVPPTPAQIQLIARAANEEGDLANAYDYMAEYYLSIGNLPLALAQLGEAMNLSDLNGVERSRFKAKFDRLIEYLPEDERERAGRMIPGQSIPR